MTTTTGCGTHAVRLMDLQGLPGVAVKLWKDNFPSKPTATKTNQILSHYRMQTVPPAVAFLQMRNEKISRGEILISDLLENLMRIIGGDPNIEIATPRALARTTSARVSRRALDSRRSKQPPFFRAFRWSCLEDRYVSFGGHARELTMFEERSAGHGASSSSRESLRDTSAAGPRPERPRAQHPPDISGPLVLKTAKSRAQPQLASSVPFSDGSKHSRRLGVFREADLKCHLGE